MNKWLSIVGIVAVLQVGVGADCSSYAKKESLELYKKAYKSTTIADQFELLNQSMQTCYSPEVDAQISLLNGDVAFGLKKYMDAKNYYNKILSVVNQIPSASTKKQLHLVSYECLRDTYKAMGEKELSAIMQEKYNMVKNQNENSFITTLVSSNSIHSSLKLPIGTSAKGISFKGARVTQSINLHVNFKFDSSEFSSDGKKQARELAIALKELQLDFPNSNVEILGFTDTKGSANYNFSLSKRRASALKNYLKSTFTFNKLDFQSKGYGETQPVCSQGDVHEYKGEYSCSGKEDKESSRRVEIIFGY